MWLFISLLKGSAKSALNNCLCAVQFVFRIIYLKSREGIKSAVAFEVPQDAVLSFSLCIVTYLNKLYLSVIFLSEHSLGIF